ncbi:MAG: hypothetical protein KGL29_14755 [Alphaproteobacteria bacterium]|nr:hypothetical protein [Alphaproteobacteria bacterium]MDE2267160.1 hypothetical protein [Alphaproteobacteria bacterium]MDE2501256.1 hypothetical protein [Alphaproteobacteria bacterium]
MRYLHVKCLHKNPNEPAHLYSEIGDDSYERRKVELYADGRKGFADETEEAGGTSLGIMPVPSLAEIAAQPGFEPKEIPQEEFQRIWLKRR